MTVILFALGGLLLLVAGCVAGAVVVAGRLSHRLAVVVSQLHRRDLALTATIDDLHTLRAALADLDAEWERLGSSGSLAMAARMLRERAGHLLTPAYEETLRRALAAEAEVQFPDDPEVILP